MFLFVLCSTTASSELSCFKLYKLFLLLNMSDILSLSYKVEIFVIILYSNGKFFSCLVIFDSVNFDNVFFAYMFLTFGCVENALIGYFCPIEKLAMN